MAAQMEQKPQVQEKVKVGVVFYQSVMQKCSDGCKFVYCWESSDFFFTVCLKYNFPLNHHTHHHFQGKIVLLHFDC